MAYPLTLYPNDVSHSSTLGTANQLIVATTISANGSSFANTVGTATGFGEITSQGTAAAWAAGSLNLNIAPTGKGWFFDAKTLDGWALWGSNPGSGGDWQALWRGLLSANTATIDLYTRIFVYDPATGVYTSVGYISQMRSSWGSALATQTSTVQPLPIAVVPPGSRLYVDLWGNITASTMVAGNTIGIRQSNSAGFGQSTCNIVTPGYDFAPGDPLWHRPRYIMRGIAGSIFTPFQAAPAWVDRAIGGRFVKPTTPVNIPRYVSRGLFSTLVNYGLNIATRFRQSQQAITDLATRFIQVSGSLQSVWDIATRFSQSQQSVRDIATRLRQRSADQLRDVATRLRVGLLRDIAVRYRLGLLRDVALRLRQKSADQAKDTATRFRQSQQRFGDTASRLRVGLLRDVAARFRQAQQSVKDVASRFRQKSADQARDVAARLRVKSADQARDVASRFRAGLLRDVAVRFRQSQRSIRDTAARFRQKSADQLKDIASRFRQRSADTPKDVASRLRVALLRDVAFRFRQKSADQLRFIATRIGVSLLRDVSLRLRLALLRDVASRFRQRSADQLRFIATRLRVGLLRDIASRARFGLLRDVATRFILGAPGQSIRDIASRFRQRSSDQLRFIATRVRVGLLRDIASRFRQSQQRVADVATRIRQRSADQARDVASRFRQRSADQVRDLASRLRVKSADGLRNLALRFCQSQRRLPDVACRVIVAIAGGLSKPFGGASGLAVSRLVAVDAGTSKLSVLVAAEVGRLQSLPSLLRGLLLAVSSRLSRLLASRVGSEPVPTPNTSVYSTITVTDSAGALVSNLSVCSVIVKYPDGTTQALAIGTGIVNQGSGKYQASYITKGVGVVVENWSVVAADGVTVGNFQFEVGVGY